MCGLVFAYDAARDPRELAEAVQRALDLLAHRGPDGGKRTGGQGWSMGHRRLSIIDLAASTQPMQFGTTAPILAYNGEVYNYRELRAELTARWAFHTAGDTEVLLAGLCLDGTAFLKRAEGMWAFALWHPVHRRLTLARDRLGKKPLYVHSGPQYIYVASELPALLRMLPSPPGEDLHSTADYFRYGFTLPGFTLYQGVHEVLPAHVLTWAPGRLPETEAYWQLRPGGFIGTKAEAAEQVRELLARAVSRRMVADVEVGAFLSGGIDSSIICTLMTEVAAQPPKTFTIGFDDAAFDERPYAREIARRLGSSHLEQCVEGIELEALMQLILRHVGQPFADASLLPTTLVSRLAAAHVKVALSGDGGDELFCGYQRYIGRVLLRWYARLPGSLRRVAEKGIRLLPEPTAHHSRSLLKKAHLFLDIANAETTSRAYVAPRWFTDKDLSKLAPDLAGLGHEPPAIPPETRLDDLEQMMYRDAVIYLPSDILLKVDRASMSASLEARAPFLDTMLVELAFSMPAAYHRQGLRGKELLRQAFGDVLPGSVWRRRKQGFAVPVHRWYREACGESLLERVAAQPSCLKPTSVRELLHQHRSGARDLGNRLFQVDTYLRWQQRYAGIGA
jgi:asparagine synthase (glutamine-hydrolysing)